MKIARYIADLLFEYECVVIPGLGGFITRNHPASIHPVRNQFKPPWKEIVFNPHLRTNDGLLINHIALSEKLTYQEAKGRIDRFVLKCLNEMRQGRRISFKKIGSLYMNNQQTLMFDADESQNYLASSFGLGTFVSHPIARSNFAEKNTLPVTAETEEPAVRPLQKDYSRTKKPAKKHERTAVHSGKRPVAQRKTGNFARQFRFLALLLLALFAGWLVMNKATVQHYYSSYASLIPFFYASPNEYLVNNMDRLPVQKYLPLPAAEKVTPEDKVMLQPAGNNLNQVQNTISVEDLYLQQAKESVGGSVEPDAEPLEKQQVILAEEVTPIEDNNAAPIVTADKKVSEVLLKKESPARVTVQESYGSSAEEELSARFYIIGGAFRDEANAEKLLNKLRQKGYSSVYAGRTKTGLLRVSYVALNDRMEALSVLEKIQKEEDQGAWLMSM